MDTLTEFSDKFDSAVNKYLEPVVTNKYIMPVLALILILYVTYVRPTLPQYVQDLFHNNIFRFVVLAYIVYRANHDIQSAILLSAVFLITMHMVNKQYVDNFYQITNTARKKQEIISSPAAAKAAKAAEDAAKKAYNDTITAIGKYTVAATANAKAKAAVKTAVNNARTAANDAADFSNIANNKKLDISIPGTTLEINEKAAKDATVSANNAKYSADEAEKAEKAAKDAKII